MFWSRKAVRNRSWSPEMRDGITDANQDCRKKENERVMKKFSAFFNCPYPSMVQNGEFCEKTMLNVLIIFYIWGWACSYRCSYFFGFLSLDVLIKEVLINRNKCTFPVKKISKILQEVCWQHWFYCSKVLLLNSIFHETCLSNKISWFRQTIWNFYIIF